MSAVLVLDIEETTLARLKDRADAHRRSVEAEARSILLEALQSPTAKAWAGAKAFRESLAATGRAFSDSAELLREDRER